VVCGIAVYFILPTNAQSASWLTDEEKTLIRTIRSRETGQTESAQKFHWNDVREGFKDWQLWVFSLSSFTNDIMFYGFSTFLPSIIKGIGKWSAPQAQALTVPVYAVGTGVYLAVAQLSDRQGQRGIYAASFGFVSVVGYCMLIANANAAVSYTGCFVVAIGLYVTVGLPLAWLPGNKPRYAKRALSSGMQLTFGNMAGIVMPFLYSTKDAPKYYTGYGVSIASVSLSVCIFAFMTLYYTRLNKQRAAGSEDWKMEGKTDEDIQEMGDKSPKYVYQT